MSYMETRFASPGSSIQELSFEEVEAVVGGLPDGVAAAGGILIGVGEAGHVSAFLRAGFMGARIGAFAGPIGLAAGVVAGVGTYYILRNHIEFRPSSS